MEELSDIYEQHHGKRTINLQDVQLYKDTKAHILTDGVEERPSKIKSEK